jgi:hypothetical protein
MYKNTSHTSIIKLRIKPSWYDNICSIQTYILTITREQDNICSIRTYILTITREQDKNVPSRSLFQEQRAPLHASNSNSREQVHERTPNTKRKPCPMQPDKERLHVLCNSKTTTEAIFCINIDMYRLVVVFQSHGRLRDNCKCPKQLQMS